MGGDTSTCACKVSIEEQGKTKQVKVSIEEQSKAEQVNLYCIQIVTVFLHAPRQQHCGLGSIVH